MLTAFLWFVVSIYAPEYMKHEGRTGSFKLCTLLTLSAVLGVFLAGDLFTMLLFFEMMTITSFFWVVHRWNKEAVRAGYFYLFFSIIGGLFLALGIVLMGAATDVLPSVGAGFVTPLDSRMFAWSVALFVAGFGIKAGMVPLHLWLPHAHSVSPTPSSALLSGLLIKVGAYGLIRVGEFAGWGMRLGSEITRLGPILAVLGTCTMLVGVTAALLQSDAKRLLAYHSVSQMGYIILGLGIGLYLGQDGGLGLLGAIYHIVNHALFKAALFLGVGVIYIHTKETNLYNLGGLWRRFPVTAVLMFLAVLGITGAPGLNGYASKTLLHHAVSLAAETGTPWVIWVEGLFLLVGVGTAASFSKLYYLIFLGKPTKIKVSDDGSPSGSLLNI
jgi:hydrogenase-4 component B